MDGLASRLGFKYPLEPSLWPITATHHIAIMPPLCIDSNLFKLAVSAGVISSAHHEDVDNSLSPWESASNALEGPSILLPPSTEEVDPLNDE